MHHDRPIYWRRRLAAISLLLATMLTTAGDWPTYLHDVGHTTNSSDEAILTTTNAVTLSKLWSFTTGGAIASSATVVNGTVYVGAMDGYEYALDAVTGAPKWKTYLGTTGSAPDCFGSPQAGIESTATVINDVVYVGGGDTSWYALDATTGISLWNVYVGDNSPTGGNYNWSSPLIYQDPVDNNTYAYIGVASLCDAPLVQSKLLQVNLSTHQIVNTFPVVPTGQVGGSIWTTPTADATTNTIYVTTGNNDDNVLPSSQPNTVAILALDATTLALKSSWQVPSSQQAKGDSDWTTTPILFTDLAGHQLVAAVNKGGWLYAFDHTQPISAGPLWQVNIAQGGPSPEDGDTSVSSAAFGNGLLYQAGGKTRVAGAPTLGSVRALNPSTGQVVWAHAESMWILAPLAYANGLVVDGVGNTMEVLNAATGARLYSYAFSSQGVLIYAPPSIANGRIYVSTTDGAISAFGLASGTKGGSIQRAGGSASYTFTPAISGSANFGTCAAAPITNHFSLYVYDSTGTQIASSTAPSYCNWASASVSAGQTYTIKTQAAPRQDGVYLS